MSSSPSSSPPPLTTSYGPRSLLVMALGCALFGGFFYFLYGQLREPSPRIVEDATSTSVESVSKTRVDFQRQLDELTRLHSEIAETLKALEDDVDAAVSARDEARSAYREFVGAQAEALGLIQIRPIRPNPRPPVDE